MAKDKHKQQEAKKKEIARKIKQYTAFQKELARHQDALRSGEDAGDADTAAAGGANADNGDDDRDAAEDGDE